MNITNAGLRGYNPKGVVIHNDAGSNNANVAFYSGWLPGRNKELGFAHVYIASDGRLQASDFANKAWHAGNTYANTNYASWEVCQSEGDEAQFLRNEQAVLDDVAKYMKQWGLVPNKDTVKLHRELSATSCPRRSVALHGGTLESCRSYFISELQKRLELSNNGSSEEEQKPTQPNEKLERLEDNELMKFTYTIKGDGTVYYFDGQKVMALSHADQLKIIREIYKATTGQDLKQFNWTKEAPWHVRFMQAHNIDRPIIAKK